MDIETIVNTALKDFTGVFYIVIALFFMWVAKVLNEHIPDLESSSKGLTLKTNYEIEEKSNLAVALRSAGFYLAIAIGMFGAIYGPSRGFSEDVVVLLIDGSLIVVCMLMARLINDVFVVPGLANTEAICEGNLAVGLVEFGGYIATGIILMAAFGVEHATLMSSLAYFLLGQVVLLVAIWLYQKTVSWDVKKHLHDGNASAGLMIGGIMIAIAVAIAGATNGTFVNWAADLSLFCLHVLIAIVLLFTVSKVIDRMFLPNTSRQKEIAEDHNVAAIAVIVSVKIAVALMINAAVL